MPNKPLNGKSQERGSGARTPNRGSEAINEGARAPKQPRPSKRPKR